MGFALRDGISFCETGGRFIFLDIVKDRYTSLAGEAECSFRRLALGEPLSCSDHAVLSGLVASGLLDPAPGGARPLPCATPPKPERSLVDEDYPVGPAVLVHALWRLTRSAMALKLRPLWATVARLERRKARLESDVKASDSFLAEVAAGFKRTALIAAPLDQCLPRSVAAAHALLDRNIRADLVIGVRLQPFGAHCWVQHGSTLVNEAVDQVRNFTPILVV
jgi:hypothetical protein